jgi:hypothetical protein
MNGDRELLEKAAKAAGLPVEWDGDGFVIASKFRGHLTNYEAWNPLLDDGDALRLAVKLRLVIQHAPKYVVVMDHAREIAEHEDTRENGDDPYAATRRAITRAAAAVADVMGREG